MVTACRAVKAPCPRGCWAAGPEGLAWGRAEKHGSVCREGSPHARGRTDVTGSSLRLVSSVETGPRGSAAWPHRVRSLPLVATKHRAQRKCAHTVQRPDGRNRGVTGAALPATAPGTTGLPATPCVPGQSCCPRTPPHGHVAWPSSLLGISACPALLVLQAHQSHWMTGRPAPPASPQVTLAVTSFPARVRTHIETLQPGRVHCHVCLARDSVLCDALVGLPAGTVPSRSGTRPASLLLAVGVMPRSAPSEGPHAEVSLRRVGDQDVGPRASVCLSRTGPGARGMCLSGKPPVTRSGDPGRWDGAGPGSASVPRPSPTPRGRDGRAWATWGAGSEGRQWPCGGSPGTCPQA